MLAARLNVASLSLNTCALSFALAITFVGLALFLYGIDGSMNAETNVNAWTLSLAAFSPGASVS